MFNEMKTPKTRLEFERAFHFLSEQLRNNKMMFSAHMVDGINSLRSVRNLPNGRIDFLSVNESARLNANMMLNMATRRTEMEETFEEAKNSARQNSQPETQVVKPKSTKKKPAKKKSTKKKSTKKKPAKKKPAKKKSTKKKSTKKKPAKKKPAKKKPAKTKPAKKKPAKKKPAKTKPAKKK